VVLVFGFPYSCGSPQCEPGADHCGESCGNLLGMYFRGGFVPLLPVIITIVIGLAVGWLVGLAISKLRSRGA
jgi:hypothetical protein